MQNFDPAKATAAITDLCLRVQNVESVLKAGGIPLADVAGGANDVLLIVEGFVPRLQKIEEIFSLLLPLVPVLQKMALGEVAGTGAAQVEDVVIPSSELGLHSNDPVVIEPRPVVEEKPASFADKLKAALSSSQGV